MEETTKTWLEVTPALRGGFRPVVGGRRRACAAAEHRQRREGVVRRDRQDPEPAAGQGAMSIIDIRDPIKPRISPACR
jgi:hypothetical protein